MIFVTSDHHFDHERIIEYCKREYRSSEEMNEDLIRRWNDVVAKDDLVFHLGDFALTTFDRARWFLSRLNGEIKMLSLPWHHDRRWIWELILDPQRHDDIAHVELIDPIRVVDHGNHTVTMSHYPMLEWEASYHGGIHLHGHCHGNRPKMKNALDVSIDCHNGYPITMERAIDLALQTTTD